MKAVCKKLFSLMLVAILLVSAVPFQASAEETVAPVTEEPTVATEAAVVEAAAEIEEVVVATTPVANAEVVTNDIVYLEFEIHHDGGEYRVGNLVQSKIGARFNPPNEGAVLNVLKSVIGNADGYKLVRWELADGTTFTGATIINLSMDLSGDSYYNEKTETEYPLIHIKAIVEKVEKTIVLNANGGTIANNKFKVMVGERYDYFGGLPTPTKAGSAFLGWFKADGHPVTNETLVTDLGTLTAKWATGRYNVTFESFASGDWAAADGFVFDVDNNTILKTAFNNFPTEAQIKALFKAEGWTIDGWEYSSNGGDSWSTFTEGKTKITANTIIRPLYKKDVKLVANDDGKTSRYLTVTLGKRVPVLPNPGTREHTNEDGTTVNQAFVGWFSGSTVISTRYDLSDVSKHPIYTDDLGDTFTAGWKDAYTIYLYIHTNGNTKEHTKLVKYFDVPAGVFKLDSIDLAEIFPNYGKYDDKGDEKWGWYNETQWENFCLGRHKYDTTEIIYEDYFENDDVREFYIMLNDNGNNTSTGGANGNGYNDNKTTVDSSNPSTGDDIFVAVTIMAVSACAVLLMFMNKKRFVK